MTMIFYKSQDQRDDREGEAQNPQWSGRNRRRGEMNRSGDDQRGKMAETDEPDHWNVRREW